VITLDSGLRYRADRVCYHPRHVFFRAFPRWFELIRHLDERPGDLAGAPDPEAATEVAAKLLKHGLAVESEGAPPVRHRRPMPELAEDVLAPLDAEIYPTYRCNHACPFCSAGDASDRLGAGGDLPREWIVPIAEKLDQAGLFVVGIVGGEPFLYPHLEELVEALIGRGMHVFLTTNGTAPPERIAAVYRPGMHLGISLQGDGPEENDALVGRPGSFAAATAAIRLLAEREIPFRTITVLTAPSLERVHTLVKRWGELGVPEMSFARAVPVGRARQWNLAGWDAPAIRRLETAASNGEDGPKIRILTGVPFRLGMPQEEQKQVFFMRDGRRCDSGVRGLYIAPTADVYPCELLARGQYKLGNLLEDPWPEFLATSPVLAMLRNLPSPESCRSCRYVSICRGGCPGLQSDDADLCRPMRTCPFQHDG